MPSLIREEVTTSLSALYIDRTYQGWPEIGKQIQEFARRNKVSTTSFEIDQQFTQPLARIVDADSLRVKIWIHPDIGRYRKFIVFVEASQSQDRQNRQYAELRLYVTAPEKRRDLSYVRMIASFEELDEQSLQKAKWYMQKLFSIAYKAAQFMDQSYKPKIDISHLFEEDEEEDREQQKDTDEVQPATDMDSDAVHGGKSNSAEVDSQAAKPKQNNDADRQQQETKQSHGIQSQQDQQNQNSQNAEQGKQNEENKQHENQNKQGQQDKADQNAEHQNGRSNNEPDKKDAADHNNSGQQNKQHKPQQNTKKLGRKPSSFRQIANQSKAVKTDMKPLRQFGGYFRKHSNRAAIAKRYAIRFNRILNKLAAESKEGPRWKYSKVAQKVLSFRIPKVQDRRLEAGRPAVMFLLDFSASMGSFVSQSSLLIDAATQLGTEAKVIVVATSNGYPQEVYIDAKKVKQFGRFGSEDQVKQEYEQLIRKHNVRIAVCFADSDGAWVYERIAELVDRFYWLHNFSCSSGRIRRRAPNRSWSRSAKNNTVMYVGVGSVDQVIEALEDAIK